MDKRYVVKIATTKDIDDLVRMRFSLQEHMSKTTPFLWKLSPKRLSEQVEFYRKMMSNEDIRLLVIYDEESKKNIGMAFGWKLTNDQFIPNKSGRIEDMWIDPAHRRKGLCKSLLSELVQFFSAAGVASLTLQYVEGNHEAEHIWTKLGFHIVLRTANASLAEVEEKCALSETQHPASQGFVPKNGPHL
jgi:ribosomal protein S18 acetylase RimI-like enzyme